MTVDEIVEKLPWSAIKDARYTSWDEIRADLRLLILTESKRAVAKLDKLVTADEARYFNARASDLGTKVRQYGGAILRTSPGQVGG